MYKFVFFIILGWLFAFGFLIGAMFTNILIFNDPETIDIANGLVYCKNKG